MFPDPAFLLLLSARRHNEEGPANIEEEGEAELVSIQRERQEAVAYTGSTRRGGEMPPQAPQSQVKNNILKFLKSFLGITRILQIVFGAGLWVTMAANKYEGSIHFVLFVAVLFWLLTLDLFLLTLLDKQDIVPFLGGERWLCSNLAHDVAAAALYVPAIGILIHKTDRNSFCNLDQYKHLCLYKVYLTATVFACLCFLTYLLSVVYGARRKCRGEQTVI